ATGAADGRRSGTALTAGRCCPRQCHPRRVRRTAAYSSVHTGTAEGSVGPAIHLALPATFVPFDTVKRAWRASESHEPIDQCAIIAPARTRLSAGRSGARPDWRDRRGWESRAWWYRAGAPLYATPWTARSAGASVPVKA